MVADRGKEVTLAYFTVRRTQDQEGYIGAILVIDNHGIPKEFRCTHPIRPTVVQKALYGNNLESQISFELCGKPLIGELTSDPVACLVDSTRMLGLREAVALPVIHVQRLGEVLDVSAESEGGAGGRTERLDSGAIDFQPLAVNCYAGFETDFEDTLPVLREIFQYVDLMEPFERVATAVTVLGERDERFR